MIEIRGLTKIYRGKRHKETVALSGLNFCLPDRGMVFVVGKSGCGKSTLLNVIGGGDRFTEGEIIIDGNHMSAFTARDYDDFRNGVVGLIFQDYCLLEGLTVRENVALSLELAGKKDDALVADALRRVELEDKAESFPKELSGGQKQRAAIARVLVKDAKYILADEPTGNLDSGSSRIVLRLLKELSKTRLVLIVSHNRADADEFADRIIELSDGHIIGDHTRNEEAKELSFGEGEIVFQRGHNFTEEELEEVNRRRAEGSALRQVDTRFRETPQMLPSEGRTPFVHRRLSGEGMRTLFRLFTKRRALSMALSALCVVFLFIVLGVCQFFTRFDAEAETARIMAEHSGSVLAMRKGYIDEDDPTKTLDKTRLLRVTEEDIEAFRGGGYKGNIFPLYGVSMITHGNAGAMWEMQGYKPPPEGKNYNQFYCHTGLGVLQVTEEYLTKLYGTDGKLNVLSGEIKYDGVGIIVTDYFADSILMFDPTRRVSADELEKTGDPYSKLTSGGVILSRYRVAAVIETGYKERYAPLIEARESGKNIVEAEADLAMRFYEELNDGLNLAYTVNPNFMEEYSVAAFRNFAYFGGGTAEIEGNICTLSSKYVYCDKSLKDNEIAVLNDIYCNIMSTDSTKDAVGKTIKLQLGDIYAKSYYYEGEFTVKRCFASDNGTNGLAFYVSPNVFKKLLPPSIYAYALYFDDVEGAMDAYETGTEMGFYVQSPLFSAMYTVSNAAVVFIDFFQIIIWAMYALVGLTLAGFAAGSVKKCMYEIGVVRAMGAKTKDVLLLFVLQMILVSAAVCLVAGLGLWLGAGLCNRVLAEGFASITKNAAMRGIRFIAYSWRAVLLDAGIIFGLTALCALVPLLLLRRIKPREIIRAKE